MKGKIDAILKDIYALEPELRQHETEVRALVSTLMKARPAAVPDPAFIARLREEVLISVPRSVPMQSAGRDLSWWVFHLAPIGVFAVLTLALVGDRAFAPTALPIAPPQSDQDLEISTERMSSPSSGGNGMMTMMDDSGVESVPSSDASFSSLKMVAPRADETAITMTNSITGREQVSGNTILIPHVWLEAPGHIRVFAYNEGPRTVLGTTPVIAAGESFEIPIVLERTVIPGETLYAQLFVSDGDETFEPYEDVPARDGDGSLVYTTFMIVE